MSITQRVLISTNQTLHTNFNPRGARRGSRTPRRQHSSPVNTSDGTRLPSTSLNSLAKCRTLLNPKYFCPLRLYHPSIRFIFVYLWSLQKLLKQFPCDIAFFIRSFLRDTLLDPSNAFRRAHEGEK